MTASPSTIVLRAGHAEAGIAPAIGGALTHFHWVEGARTLPWLRATAAADLQGGTSDRLSCFPLVPYSNRIREGRFVFEGRSFALPLNAPPERHSQHGHGWQRAWNVVELATDRATIEYTHAADAWPFAYRARQHVTLGADALQITLSIENRSEHRMPVGLGLHPYFPSTPRCTLVAAVEAMWATDAEVMPTTLVPADPRLASPDGMPPASTQLDNVFTAWRRKATIRWPEHGTTLELDADWPLGFLVVYSPPGEGYFCAEPVSHCTDAFNLAAQGAHGTGMLTLAPGATVGASVRFRPSIAGDERV